jgi:hypothetical protein
LKKERTRMPGEDDQRRYRSDCIQMYRSVRAGRLHVTRRA